MKKVVTILSSTIALLTCTAAIYANVPAKSMDKKAANVNVLFVMLAKEASIQTTTTPGTSDLSLKAVNPKVIYFSSIPARISGHMPTAKFIDQWKNGAFSKVPPNAVVEVVKLDEQTNKLKDKENSYTVVLDQPTFSAEHPNDVTFKIKALPGHKALPVIAKSDYVAIFIDDVCLSCIG